MTLTVPFVVILAILLVTAESKSRWNELDSYTHEKYASEFGKQYTTESERLYRKSIFERKLYEIKMHNQKNLSWKEGVNAFTDYTMQEFQAMNGYRSSELPKPNAQRQHVITGKAIPASVDYRTKPGVLTAVKDQGRCGSCWAFSSASSIESQWFLASGKVGDLSIQQIASCTSNPRHMGGYGGCHGGFPDVAFQNVINNGGITSEWKYPYLSYYGKEYPCKFYLNQTQGPVVQVSDFRDVKLNDYYSFIDALANVGPFSILVDARAWQRYESGIFDGCPSEIALDHAVQLVGYGSENNQDYWIVRNSWGAGWGENGYIRIIRQYPLKCYSNAAGKICGACGVNFYGAYPIISNSKP